MGIQPQYIVENIPFTNVAIVHYGVYSPLFKLFTSESINKVWQIDIYASLNCGFETKRWRKDFKRSQMPTHFLDQYFTLLEDAFGQSIKILDVKRLLGEIGGHRIDREWSIRLEITRASGPLEINIHARQYNGPSEFMFDVDHAVALGGSVAGVVDSSGYRITTPNMPFNYTYGFASLSATASNAAKTLARFMIEQEGYPQSSQTEGLACQIVEFVDHWLSSDEQFDLILSAKTQSNALRLAEEIIRLV